MRQIEKPGGDREVLADVLSKLVAQVEDASWTAETLVPGAYKSAPTRKGDVHHKKMGRTAAYAEEARHGPRPPGGG